MLIDVKNLTFAYYGSAEPVFENLNLQLDTDWKLGLIGRNGYGKTTFLNLLRNKLEYSGKIISPVSFEYFPYVLEEKKTVREAVFSRLPHLEDWQLDCELSLLEVSDEIADRPFKTLSSGEQIKVLLAVMFLHENAFMLIDEPTNHLDAYGRTAVADYLKKKKGFILVSHDRDFLNRTVDHVLTIEKNKIYVQNGNYDTWEENKIRQDNFEIEKNIRLRKEIKRLKEAARQKAGWADLKEKTKSGQGPCDRGFISHKAAKLMKRAKNIERNANKVVTEKEKLLKNIERIEDIPMRPLHHHAKHLIEASALSVSYGGKKIFSPVDFSLEAGGVLSLNGKNGAGKSSILKLLMGEKIEFSGILKKAQGLKVSYIPQNFDFLKGPLFDFIEESNIDKTIFLTTLRKLNFPQDNFDKKMETYSGGQKKKVLLTRSICESAHLYIWDEPLNYIDVISRLQIERMILKYSPAIILVEHDKKFNEKVSTDFVELLPNP
ncbi:ABC-F type ribosomal protection protein [Treponema sp. OMZ 792]|uniref:ribosomal protection-like ABC-F family protein n=1 Tax=unclassified Treponema TaxID=2638727 RepID=UPI0020A59894|nr:MULTISPECIES: ABC-F type ribosomal protection protein [unclassified Treponema]UTC75151.1 ABC-F type ribosomal protection protein [Treponema sp. OMZ 792]UTC81547.1 ABC-F type ribosomal protection protein [Treponema sp. OMZ 798]